MKDSQGRSGNKYVATHANVLAKTMMAQRELRIALDKFERSKLIEIYVARSGGETPEEIPEELKVPYEIEVKELQVYLLGNFPPDTLLQKLFSIMSK